MSSNDSDPGLTTRRISGELGIALQNSVGLLDITAAPELFSRRVLLDSVERVGMRNLEGTFVELRSIQVDDAAITFMWRQSARASYLGGAADSIEKQAEWIDSRPKDEINFIIINKKNRKFFDYKNPC